MKKYILFMITLGISSSVLAKDEKFVNADDSKHSDICIAAVESKKALKSKAAEYRYTQAQIDRFTCNGISIEAFAKKYRSSSSSSPIQVFSFDNSVGSIEADICIAAANSNKEYKKIKATVKKPASFFNTIACNGVPLKVFANKYGNKSFKG
jgi:hypothetical protein